MTEDQFRRKLEKSLKDMGFRCDQQGVANQWDNTSFAVVVTVWNDDTVDICGISDITMRDVVGPLMDAMNQGEAD
jgi:hypothetical protein